MLPVLFLLAIAALNGEGASLVVQWTPEDTRAEKISLLPVDVALPPGWTREQAIAQWTRPASGGEQQWESLPEGTYQIVLRSANADADATPPHDLGEVMLAAGDRRTVRVTLPAVANVNDAAPLALLPTPAESERLSVSYWRRGIPQPVEVKTTPAIEARIPCTRDAIVLVESPRRIGSAVLDGHCAGPVRVPMFERATLGGRVALPRGTKPPAGGIVRLGACGDSPPVDVPFALAGTRIALAVPARCGEASLRLDGFAPFGCRRERSTPASSAISERSK